MDSVESMVHCWCMIKCRTWTNEESSDKVVPDRILNQKCLPAVHITPPLTNVVKLYRVPPSLLYGNRTEERLVLSLALSIILLPTYLYLMPFT